MLCRLLLVGVMLSGGLAFSAAGQTTTRFGEYDVLGTSYHKFVLPGEATISILVLGSGNSGIYDVGRDTDLGRLVALTGIALTPDADRVAKVTLRLYRTEGAQRREIYKASLEQFLALPGDYPSLLSGDVLVVETKLKTKFGWRDGFSIITTFAALALAVERFTRAF